MPRAVTLTRHIAFLASLALSLTPIAATARAGTANPIHQLLHFGGRVLDMLEPAWSVHHPHAGLRDLLGMPDPTKSPAVEERGVKPLRSVREQRGPTVQLECMLANLDMQHVAMLVQNVRDVKLALLDLDMGDLARPFGGIDGEMGLGRQRNSRPIQNLQIDIAVIELHEGIVIRLLCPGQHGQEQERHESEKPSHPEPQLVRNYTLHG